MEEKTCTLCGLSKPISEFFRRLDNGPRIKYRPGCKKCYGAQGAEYKRNNPDARKKYLASARVYWQKRKFGITAEDYELILRSQGGGCAICGTTDPQYVNGSLRMYPVDHDHETGIVRGILCDTCNRGLGLMQDNPDLLRKAAAYLERKR